MNKIKILYVDSCQNYAQKFLAFLLNKEYDVKYTSSLKDALIDYSFHKPDLIIFDINLDDGSGLDLIKNIKKHTDVHSFILTENVTQEVLLETISLKIDKFFFKAQAFEEIDHEIEKLEISNSIEIEKSEDILYDLGENFLYEKNSFHIVKSENLIPLTAQETQLLDELIKSKGECVSYAILQNSIGKDEESTIDTLRTVIKKIRKKTYNGIIKNQSGVGYKVTYYPPIDLKNDLDLEEFINVDLKVLMIKASTKKLDALSYQLSKFGFECDCVNTLSSAKDYLLSQKYDYIISDLNLPDGETIDLIREIEDINSTKIIILSNSKDIHYKDYLYFKGILDYLVDIDDIKQLSYTLYKTIKKVESNTRFNNILVIEQSKRICEQIKDLLLPRNYNIDILNELTQAYNLLKTKTYSLVILDIDYENSFEFIMDIKNTIDKSIPFIVLSDTNRTYPTVRLAYKSGASECLRKPIYAEEFILKVDQLADHSKLVQELIEQKELIESYKTIVDQSAIISKTDKFGVITYVNEIFCQISGYSKEELVGKPHNIIRHPDNSKQFFRQMWKTIKEDKNIWCGVVKNRAKNGESYIVQTSIMPLKDKDGNIIEYIALRNDVTSIFKKEQN